MKTPKTLRGKYKRLCNLSYEYMILRSEFSIQMEGEFGFDHSATDDVHMIDAIEYGSGALSFKEFIDRAEFYKKQYEDTGSFNESYEDINE